MDVTSDEVSSRLAANLAEARRRIVAAAARAGRPANAVTLVAVTKYVEVDIIRSLYQLGQRDFAENRPQRLWERAPLLPEDARWHLIGSLQTNKARRTLPLIELLHSVDRLPLAEVIDAEAQRSGRAIAVLLEVNISGEESKHGFTPTSLRERLDALTRLPSLAVRGLMTMAPLADDPEASRPVFAGLRQLAADVRQTFPNADLLSMGMSQDYEVAVEEGATHVRIGSALFEGCLGSS